MNVTNLLFSTIAFLVKLNNGKEIEDAMRCDERKRERKRMREKTEREVVRYVARDREFVCYEKRE
jgi:hypothetical protein